MNKSRLINFQHFRVQVLYDLLANNCLYLSHFFDIIFAFKLTFDLVNNMFIVRDQQKIIYIYVHYCNIIFFIFMINKDVGIYIKYIKTETFLE